MPGDGSQPPDLKPALHELLERLPREPGVYLLKGHDGKILYIGKGKNLAARVRSYFSEAPGDTRAFVPLLERIVGDIETIVTRNDKEALLLENNLIKEHTPRFNVMLRDDKNYLVLRLDPMARYPRLEVTRRIGGDRARYFGPYHSATSCRRTLRLVNRQFQLRTCTDRTLNSRQRPCLQHQIGRCLAPCVLEVDPDLYQQQVNDVTLLLRGRGVELVKELERRMTAAAATLQYELAARIRDQIEALRAAQLSQQVVADTPVDQDVFGLHREGDQADLVVLQFRDGKLIGRRPYSLSGQEFPDDELLSGFISRYYLQQPEEMTPALLLVPFALEDAEAKRQWLADLRGGAVEILVPQRGPRRKLLDLARQNARANFTTRRRRKTDLEQALVKLQDQLKLSRLPRRIECFDISGFQGQLVVASMAVLVDGEPHRGSYRHFTIQSEHKDDFASMYEVLSRRLKRAVDGESSWALPDLMVVDGGKAQLSMALAALRDVGLPPQMPAPELIALAKERPDPDHGEEKKRPERVYLPHVKDPRVLRPNSAALFLLTRVRDEAHRFAITHHKKMRRRQTLRSGLDDIPGIGPRRRSELLKALGSLKRIREASVEDLARVPTMTFRAAEAVAAYFRRPPKHERAE